MPIIKDIILDDKLVYIAIGLRFKPHFILEDKLGEITDKILCSPKQLFNQYNFKIQHINGLRKLTNEKETIFLTINSQNIILEVKDIKKYSYTEIEEFFEDEILNQIIEKYKITDINRIGYIRRYEFTEKQILNAFDKNLKINNLNDFNFHFSKKDSTPQSQVKQEINDYFNSIYDFIKLPNTDKLIVSLDTQKYYNPYIDYTDFISEKEYKLFVEKVNDYNKNKFIKWLNNYCGEQIYDTK